jgi:chorismate mutase
MAPPVSAGEPAGLDALRAGVDELDRELQALVARRRALSNRIQALRLGRGGDRYDAGREQEVIDAYVDALGPEGAALAEAVLRVCRGPSGPGPAAG